MSGGRNDSLRVLAYADSSLFSGAEAVHCDLVRGLARSPALELACAAPRSNATLTSRIEEAAGGGVVDVPAQKPFAAAFDLYAPRRRMAVRRALAANPSDVLFVNLPSAEYGPTPVLSALPPGTKSVGLLHVPGAFGELGFRVGRLREVLSRRAMRRFDAICVVAESGRRTCERVWSEDTPVHVVRLPRPTVELTEREQARATLGLPAGTVIGMAGRISFKQKGQETFVEAAGRLLSTRPDLHFAIAGEGRDMSRLRKQIDALGLSRRVSLLGQVAPIGVFLSAIDAIAIPSRFEGMPLIALEALTAGVPGVAANIDGLIDVWPQPWLVEPGEPGELAAKLGTVVDAPSDERLRLIEQGRQRVHASTSPEPAAALEAVLLGIADD